MDNSEQIFKEFPKLETERLILRKMKAEDYNDVFDIYSSLDAIKYNGISKINSLTEAYEFVAKIIEGYDSGYFFRWAIEHKEDQRMIGSIGLHHIESWNEKLEVGYIINKGYWRQGYCKEAMTEVINYVFAVLKVHRIEASIHPENIASILLAESLGFKYEGHKREAAMNFRTHSYEDRDIYSLLQGEHKKEELTLE